MAENNTTVYKANLGKVPCAICGVETPFLGRYDLADHAQVCKKCVKTTSPAFSPKDSTLEDLKAHSKQLEDGKKLYDAYFAEKKKSIKKFGDAKHRVSVDMDTALICFDMRRGGFWIFGGTHYYTVYRVADIESNTRGVDLKAMAKGGNNNNRPKVTFVFHNVEGLSTLKFELSAGKYGNLNKFLKKTMGLSGLKGIKNSINMAKEKGAAIGEAMGSIKQAAGDMTDEANMADAAQQLIDEQEKFFYAGKEDIIKKADDAIAKGLG